MTITPGSARIYLSPPDAGAVERAMLLDAFDSNWIAPLGPHVDAFEREFASAVAVPNAVALASGTAALHLALHILGVTRGQTVLTSSLTFSATANAITYVGATPAFIDVSRDTWTIDPDLLDEELDARSKIGALPAALITVDLYGQCCDYDRILSTCARFGVPVIEDAAEALGATYRGRSAGTFGVCAAFSFNGNKIITTSGGGMLVSRDEALAGRARRLAAQARDPAPHYEHSEIGFNYRMSNLLAAVGRGQLTSLTHKLRRRSEIAGEYRRALGDVPGLTFMPIAPYGQPNHWLTCLQLDPRRSKVSREDLRLHLETLNIESRPVWKPMHLQPVFRDCRVRGGAVAAELFDRGLCVPSGSSLTRADQERVITAMRDACD